MIPRKIFTIWLNESNDCPVNYWKCVQSQREICEKGDFNFEIITKDSLGKLDIKSVYFWECMEAKKWVKASDYLRMLILYREGGIYMDADVELFKTPEEFLNNKLFAVQEKNGIYANSVVGSVPEHPILKEYLRRVDENFRGGGDLVFEPGIRAFADLIWLGIYEVTTYPPETFFIRNDNNVGYHHSLKSWII